MELKRLLLSRGRVFSSDTDSECLAHLVAEKIEDSPKISLTDAVGLALSEVTGTFGQSFLSWFCFFCLCQSTTYLLVYEEIEDTLDHT